MYMFTAVTAAAAARFGKHTNVANKFKFHSTKSSILNLVFARPSDKNIIGVIQARYVVTEISISHNIIIRKDLWIRFDAGKYETDMNH